MHATNPSRGGGPAAFNPNAILAKLRSSDDGGAAAAPLHSSGTTNYYRSPSPTRQSHDSGQVYGANGVSETAGLHHSAAAVLHDPFPAAPAWQLNIDLPPSRSGGRSAGTIKELEERLQLAQTELEHARARNVQLVQEHERLHKEWREKEADFASTLRVMRSRVAELEGHSKPPEVRIAWNDLEAKSPSPRRVSTTASPPSPRRASTATSPPRRTSAMAAACPPPAVTLVNLPPAPSTPASTRTTESVRVDLSTLTTPSSRRQSRLLSGTKSSENKDRRTSTAVHDTSMASDLNVHLRRSSTTPGKGKGTPVKPAFAPAGAHRARSHRKASVLV